MSRQRRFAFVLLSAALLWGHGLPATANDPLAGPHAFDDGIQSAVAQLEDGDCRKGIDELQALLEQHKGQDYAKARRLEIRDLMRQLACGVEHKRPKPKDLVSGELKQWIPKSGKIRIEYTPKTIQDLETRDGRLYLPARFRGPFTLEIRGSTYPTAETETPQIVFGGDQDPDSGKEQTWRVDLGPARKEGPRKPARVKASILHFDGDDQETLSTKTASAPKPGKRYKVVAKVTETGITVSLDGRSLGSAKKPRAMFGYLGFRAGAWTEAKLSGYVTATWIQSQVDEVLRTQLAGFDKTYDASQFLPGWLSDPLSRKASRPPKPPVDLLEHLPAKSFAAVQEVYNDIRMDEFDSAARRIDALRADGAPEATCEYLLADMHQRRTQLEQALVHIRRCIELEPAFLDGILMQGTLLRQLGRFDEALAFFQQATQAHAQFPRAYEEAASSMLMAGRPEDAKDIAQLAARNGVSSKKLVTLNEALAKVVNGPKWIKRYEHRSRNYHVISDMDQMTCRDASKVLEEAFEAYRAKIRWVPRDASRLFKVYLFSDRAGFLAYQGNLEEFMGKPAEQAAGLYSPLLKQLLIWNLPEREEMMNTIRHEGFHQYLDRVMPNPPTWFNEGLAVYHENAIKVDGKLTFGQVEPRYVQVLMVKMLHPLEEFLYRGPTKFYDGGHWSYAQAWLLVHMLQHTTPAYLELFQGLMKDLQSKDSFTVLQKTFPPASLPTIQKDLRAYLEKLGNT